MSDDFTITAHALERFEERFPDLYEDDEQAANLIHKESESALDEGRASAVAPLELANFDLSRWTFNKNKGLVVWTPDKTRGYVVIDSDDGQVVTTVLKGKDVSAARRMLYRDERPSRVKGEE